MLLKRRKVFTIKDTYECIQCDYDFGRSTPHQNASVGVCPQCGRVSSFSGGYPEYVIRSRLIELSQVSLLGLFWITTKSRVLKEL